MNVQDCVVPAGKTFLIAASVAPGPAAVAAQDGSATPAQGAGGMLTLEVFNAGPTNYAFLGFGPTAAAANTAVATLPAAAPAGTFAVALPVGVLRRVTIPANSFISAVANAAPVSVFVTPVQNQAA